MHKRLNNFHFTISYLATNLSACLSIYPLTTVLAKKEAACSEDARPPGAENNDPLRIPPTHLPVATLRVHPVENFMGAIHLPPFPTKINILNSVAEPPEPPGGGNRFLLQPVAVRFTNPLLGLISLFGLSPLDNET